MKFIRDIINEKKQTGAQASMQASNPARTSANPEVHPQAVPPAAEAAIAMPDLSPSRAAPEEHFSLFDDGQVIDVAAEPLANLFEEPEPSEPDTDADTYIQAVLHPRQTPAPRIYTQPHEKPAAAVETPRLDPVAEQELTRQILAHTAQAAPMDEPEFQPEPQPQPMPEPAMQAERRPEMRPEPRPEARAETIPEPQPLPRTQPRPEARSVLQPEQPLSDPAEAVEVPAPAAGRGARRAGRVKTRLLGFGSAQEAISDPLATAPAPSAQAAPAAATIASPAPVQFPVGWLVITDGPGHGTAFALFNGVSQIGRGEDQAIRLDMGDTSISRSNHAAIAYDPEQRSFYLGHGGKANLVRLNGRPVLSTEIITSGDQIRIGETSLRFVGLCGADFDWSASAEEGEPRVSFA